MGKLTEKAHTHARTHACICEQVEEWLGKLTKDAVLRAEYDKLWSEQRKYMVSELLPTSSLTAQQVGAPHPS